MKCKFCGYEWKPRVKNPKKCPSCQRWLIDRDKLFLSKEKHEQKASKRKTPYKVYKQEEEVFV